MSHEDQVNHTLGQIKEKIDSTPEEFKEFGYGLFLAYLKAYMGALELGGKGFVKFINDNQALVEEMLQYIKGLDE